MYLNLITGRVFAVINREHSAYAQHREKLHLTVVFAVECCVPVPRRPVHFSVRVSVV